MMTTTQSPYHGLWILLTYVGTALSWNTASGQAVKPATGEQQRKTEMKLWYDRPAKTWMTEALPIGNGRLGAMVFGGTEEERLQFNEISLWTGHEVNTDDHNQEGAYQAFGDVHITLPGHAD